MSHFFETLSLSCLCAIVLNLAHRDLFIKISEIGNYFNDMTSYFSPLLKKKNLVFKNFFKFGEHVFFPLHIYLNL